MRLAGFAFSAFLFHLLFTGCIAVDSQGIRGLPLRSGFYTGVRQEITLDQSDETTSPVYADVGYINCRFDINRVFDTPYEYDPYTDLFYSINASVSPDDEAFSEINVSGGFWYLSGGFSAYMNKDAAYSRSHISVPVIPFFTEVVPGYTTFSFYSGDTDRLMDIDFHYSIFDFESSRISPQSIYISLGQRFSMYTDNRSNAAFFAAFTWVQNFGEGSDGSTLLIELSMMVDNSSWYDSSENEGQPWYGVQEYDLKSRTGLMLRFFF